MTKVFKESELLSPKKACDPNTSFVVEACAGSGKTWLICSRILRFLVEGGNPSALLALTFTNKAASEMQIRLNQFLFSLATDPYEKVVEKLLEIGIKEKNIRDVFPKARSLYESILVGTDLPYISTFHAWYSKILTMSPTQLGIFSHISLCSSTKVFQENVWQRFLDIQKTNVDKKSSEFMLLVDSIGLQAIKIALCSLISMRVEVESVLKKKNLQYKYSCFNKSLKICDSKKKTMV